MQAAALLAVPARRCRRRQITFDRHPESVDRFHDVMAGLVPVIHVLVDSRACWCVGRTSPSRLAGKAKCRPGTGILARDPAVRRALTRMRRYSRRRTRSSMRLSRVPCRSSASLSPNQGVPRAAARNNITPSDIRIRQKQEEASVFSSKTPLKSGDFPVHVEGRTIKKQDGEPIAKSEDASTAKDVAERLNENEESREQDRWSA